MAPHRRLGFWIRRYLPCELTGTALSLIAAWVTLQLTSSLVAAAIAGTIGENVGFYGVAAGRTLREEWLRTAGLRTRRRRIAVGRTLCLTVVEFGPAELVDTFCIRPVLLYVGPVLIGMPVLGWIVGKLVADGVFYSFAGMGYLLGRRSRTGEMTVDDRILDGPTRADRIARVRETADAATMTKLARRYGTPLILLDPARVTAEYSRFRAALPFVTPHYAIKAQGHPAVVRVLADAGSGFDVASEAELDALLRAGVPGSRIIHTHPVKTPSEITRAYLNGVRTFVIDSPGELAKFRAMPTDARVLIRLAYRNPAAKSDLSSKFGATALEAELLVTTALEYGIHVAGFSFHVGSQIDDVEPFRRAVVATLELIDRLEDTLGCRFDTLDIGGGFPVGYRRDVVSIEQIATVIRPLLEPRAHRLSILAEPGRSLVADSAILVSSVVGTSVRDGENWAFIDDGLYGSYSNVFTEQVHPAIVAHRELDGCGAELRPTVIAGPTCDSIDIVARNYPLPPLVEGDLLVSPGMGAYTTVTASDFNGRRRARVLVLRQAQSVAPEVTSAPAATIPRVVASPA